METRDQDHDALCEAEFIVEAAAYTPCGCADRHDDVVRFTKEAAEEFPDADLVYAVLMKALRIESSLARLRAAVRERRQAIDLWDQLDWSDDYGRAKCAERKLVAEAQLRELVPDE